MKKIIKIKTTTKSYNIFIQNKSILKAILEEKNRGQKVFIIIDKKVSYLIKNLKNNKNIHILKIIGGEKTKSINYYSKICSKLLKLKIDRSSSIITIGGGTIGDLSGFMKHLSLQGLRGNNHILFCGYLLLAKRVNFQYID